MWGLTSTPRFRQTVADLGGSYRVGFSAPESADGQWHKLKSLVKKPGVALRYREGYRTEPAAPQPVAGTGENWSAALTSPLTSLRIPLRAAYQPVSGGEHLLELTVEANGVSFRREGENYRADLQVAVCEVTSDGRALPAYTARLNVTLPVSKWEETSQSGIAFRRQWTPSAAASRIRVVVLDPATGQFGSLELRPR